jgi:hypothetical protein
MLDAPWMPGLIWVRDSMVGDVMVDRSFPVELLRPLGLSWPATLAWEPQQFWELVGSLGAILELWALRNELPGSQVGDFSSHFALFWSLLFCIFRSCS